MYLFFFGGEGVVGLMPLFRCIILGGEEGGLNTSFKMVFFWRGGGLYASF